MTATPLPGATTVRFEVYSAGTTPVAVQYDSDNIGTVRLEGQRAPFAVQAALTAANDDLSLSASDLDTTELLMCRLSLDGVVVSLDVGKGRATCSASRSTATSTRATGTGARLGPVTTVPPARTTVPQLPPGPTEVTYQVTSSQPGGRVDVSYGTSSTASVERDAEASPFAVKLAIPASSSFLGVTASNGDDAPGPFLVCQLRVDGVLVEQSQGFGTTSCSISPDQLYG